MKDTKFKKVKIQKYKFKYVQKRDFKVKKIIYIIFLFISFFSGLIIGTLLIKKNPKMINRINYTKKFDIKNFITYAQCLEDFILYCIFYDIDNGFYIDVGANDPNDISVTKAFYLNGWHGINIEPLPDMYKKLTNERIRDINLNIGASEKEDILTLSLFGGCSSVNKKYFVKNGKTINIKVYPLSKICEKYVPKNEEIQFCKIDVEGHEKEVLLGFDFENYRPKVFCLESVEPLHLAPNYKEWEYILLRNGYVFGYEYKVNRYYFDSKLDYINKRFLNLEKYINEYNETRKRNISALQSM